MSRLADLSQSINNALAVLGKPYSLKWQVFENVNGKLSGPEIASQIKKAPSNVTLTLTYLANKGLLVENGKHGKAIIYHKAPELRGTNLRSHLKKGTRKLQTVETQKVQHNNDRINSSIMSKVVEKVLTIGKKYSIENIDQNWLDALVVLNFIETSTTKFLMEHDYQEEDVKKMKWEEKNTRLHDKLQEEAKMKGVTLRSATLSIIKNYREQRNNVDHVGHLASSKISSDEVKLLSHILQVFVKEVFDEHKKYCPKLNTNIP